MDKPRSRRCSVCDTNWPFAAEYEMCPLGHGSTWVAYDEQPLSDAAAKAKVKAYKDFDYFYDDYEDREIKKAVEELLTAVSEPTAA